MKTLRQHIDDLIDLEQADPANENMKVYAAHGSSGATDEVGSAFVSDYIGEAGPFDLSDGEKYISIYIGN